MHRNGVQQDVARLQRKLNMARQSEPAEACLARPWPAERIEFRPIERLNEVRALQMATHSPIDESEMTIKVAALFSRRWTGRSPSVRTGGRLSTE